MNNTTVSQSDYIDKHAFDNFDSFILWFLTKWMRKVASVEAIFAALGNLLVLFLTLRSKEFHKSYYNWLVIFLAVAEALQAINFITVIVYLTYLIDDPLTIHSRFICVSLATWQFISGLSGELSILLMAIDRFLAIKAPFFYRNYLIDQAQRRARWTFLLTSFIFLILILYQFFGLGLQNFNTFCNGLSSTQRLYFHYVAYLMPMISVIIIALYVFVMHGIYNTKGLQDNDVKKQMYQSQRTAFKRTSDVIVAFFIFWVIPSISSFLIMTFDIKNTTFVSTVALYGTMGNITNSLCNVWINLKRNKEVHDLFIKLLPTNLYKMLKRHNSTANQPAFISSITKAQRAVRN